MILPDLPQNTAMIRCNGENKRLARLFEIAGILFFLKGLQMNMVGRSKRRTNVLFWTVLAMCLFFVSNCWAAGLRLVPLVDRVQPGESFGVDVWAEGIPADGLSSVQFRFAVDAGEVDVIGVSDLSQGEDDSISVSSPLMMSEPTTQRSGLGSMFLNGQGDEGILVIENETFANHSALYTYSHTKGSLLSSGNGTISRIMLKVGENVDVDSFNMFLSDVFLMNDRRTYPLEYASGAAVTLRCAVSAPDLRGLSLSDAVEVLSEQDLAVGNVYEIDNPQGLLELGVVLQQSEAPGVELECGRSIDLAINTAPAEVTDLRAEDLSGDDTGKIVLSWLPSTSSDVAGYRVYDESRLLRDLPQAQSSGTEIDGLENGVTQQLRVCVYDAFGNQSSGSAISVTALDDVPPVVEISGVLEGNYYNQPITPAVTVFENNLLEKNITLNGDLYDLSTLESDGHYELVVVAKDSSGNETHRRVTFTVDRTSPAISFLYPVESLFYSTDILPNVTIDDANLNELETVFLLNGDSYQMDTPITDEGAYTLAVMAKDMAGNVAEKSIQFGIDKTAPVSVLTIGEPIFENELGPWVSSQSLLSLTALDSGENPAGVAAIEYKIDDGSWREYSELFMLDACEDGDHVLSYRAIDQAGNTESGVEKLLLVDNSSPVTAVQFFNQSYEVETQQLITRKTIIELVASDALSGLGGVYYRLDEDASYVSYNGTFQLEELEYGEHTLSFFSVDNLGNVEIEQTVDFVLIGVEVSSSLTNVPRILIWTSNPDNNRRNGWFFNHSSNYSFEDVQGLFQETFNEPEAFYTVVTEFDDFERELMSNVYNVVMIMDQDTHPPARFYRKIEEYVSNGMGLLIANWGNHLSPLIAKTLGVKGLGVLPFMKKSSERLVYFYPGSVFTQQDLMVMGDRQRVKVDGGVLAGVVQNERNCIGLRRVTLGYPGEYNPGDEIVVSLYVREGEQNILVDEERYYIESFCRRPVCRRSGNPRGDISIETVSDDLLRFTLSAPYGCLESSYYAQVEILHLNGDHSTTGPVYLPTACEDHLQEGVVISPFHALDVKTIGRTDEDPAIVLNQCGEGKTVFFSHSVLDSAFSSDRSRHIEMLQNATKYLLPEISETSTYSTVLLENKVKAYGAELDLSSVEKLGEGFTLRPLWDLDSPSLHYRFEVGDNEEAVYRYFVDIDFANDELKKETGIYLNLDTEEVFFDNYVFEPEFDFSLE